MDRKHPCSAVVGVLFVLLALMLGGCKPDSPAHGTLFVLQLGTNPPGAIAALSEVIEPLRARFDALGMQPFFERQPGGDFVLKVGRLRTNQISAVRQMITAQGQLEFRMIHPNSDELVQKGLVVSGYELLKQSSPGPGGHDLGRTYLVNCNPERGLTGKYIKRVTVTMQAVTGAPELGFELDAEGARLFEEITRQYQPSGGQYRQLAIVLDGQIFSIPRIVGVITAGRGHISGALTVPQALALQSILENPLNLPCRVIEQRSF